VSAGLAGAVGDAADARVARAVRAAEDLPVRLDAVPEPDVETPEVPEAPMATALAQQAREAMAAPEEEEDVPDNVVLASVGEEKIRYADFKRILRDLSPGRELRRRDFANNPTLVGNILERELTMRALAAYAKKQGVDGSEGYKSTLREMERFVLGGMVSDDIAAKNVEVTDKEIEVAYAEHSATMVRDGKKVPLAMVKEQIRAALRNQKGEKTVDAYLVELKKKAKITVNDAVLPKV